eukprot:734328-Prymnesium_polylepis.1
MFSSFVIQRVTERCISRVGVTSVPGPWASSPSPQSGCAMKCMSVSSRPTMQSRLIRKLKSLRYSAASMPPAC